MSLYAESNLNSFLFVCSCTLTGIVFKRFFFSSGGKLREDRKSFHTRFFGCRSHSKKKKEKFKSENSGLLARDNLIPSITV
ncbi:hypothetical protein LEP1GSC168_2729 [Leptospira santarosai str. HAI134]|nr:hypothetical protein LEP1GSC168_2729 [Leptospira santarosai str. HAI134]